MLHRCDAFWLKGTGSNLNPGASHLHFVLTNSCANGEQLIANMTSRHPGVPFDVACMLEIGDHADITGPSYVVYDRCRTVSDKNYGIWRFGRQMIPTAQANAALIDRICEGVLVSEHTTPRMKAYFEANRNNP